MFPVTRMHEVVQQRACQEQKVGNYAEDMGPMLFPLEGEDDCEEA